MLIWHQILYFPCKYLKQKHFQAPSSSLESYWSCFSGQTEYFIGLYIIHGESVVIKQRPVGNVRLFGHQVRGLSAPEVWKWLHGIILIKVTNQVTVFQWFSSVEKKSLECCCCVVREPSDSSWFFSSLWSVCYPSVLRMCCVSGIKLCAQNWKLN